MAIAATVVWELRATATAGNLNGGGFNSALGGTDYTLQDTAQINGLTNLTTSGAGATTITSASAPFTSQMVGNLVHITAGTNFQTGWYEVRTFTDTSNVILDRTPSSGGAGASGVFYLGGAMSLNSTLDDAMFEAATNGNIYYIKAGTYSTGQAISIAKNASVSAPIKIIGYNTVRGDDPIDDNRPLINTGTNNFLWLGTFWKTKNFRVVTTGPTNGVAYGASPSGTHENIKVTNTSTTATQTGFRIGIGAAASNIEAICLNGYGVSFLGEGILRNSYVHDSLVGVRAASGIVGAMIIEDNIIQSNTSKAIELVSTNTSLALISNNTLYGAANKVGVGIDIGTNSLPVSMYNNIISGFVTGVTCPDALNAHIDNYNDYYNNTTDVVNITKGPNDSSLNPTFFSVTQKVNVGTVSSSTNVLTDTGADFSAITDNVDIVNIVSGTGTGFATGAYLITGHTPTTLTLSSALTSSGSGSSIVYQITLGRNFAIGINLKGLGTPGLFPGGFTTGYMDIGGAQRQELGGGGGSYTYTAG